MMFAYIEIRKKGIKKQNYVNTWENIFISILRNEGLHFESNLKNSFNITNFMKDQIRTNILLILFLITLLDKPYVPNQGS